ncbi:MAG: amidohydrolase family protein [Pseudomonadota bacterium]
MLSLIKSLCASFIIVLAVLIPASGQMVMPQNAEPEVTYIHAGRLIAIPGEDVKTEQTIIISGAGISEIRDGYATPPQGAATINLKNMTVLPGLIDSHTHLLTEYGPAAFFKSLTQNQVEFAFDGVVNARKTLMAGFTTVQDLGGGDEAIFALRDAIAAGKTPGPRVLASGRQIRAVAEDKNYNSAVGCAGADECRRITRQQIIAGADVIKVTLSGGEPLSSLTPPIVFFDEELEAIVETAKTMERKVTCHAMSPDKIKQCLRAGVHSIEHGSYMDDEAAKLAKKTGATFVPTLVIGPVMESAAVNFGLPQPIAEAFSTAMLDAVKIAKKRNVPIALGSDSGPSKHGENANELLRLVEAGLSPEEAIRAATVTSARHLGLEARIGAIEVGKSADIIAVDGDPLEDIAELLTVDFVMKAGVVYKKAE